MAVIRSLNGSSKVRLQVRQMELQINGQLQASQNGLGLGLFRIQASTGSFADGGGDAAIVVTRHRPNRRVSRRRHEGGVNVDLDSSNRGRRPVSLMQVW